MSVLDPFMGSGTTAVAAKQTGRKWVGYDISQEYVDLASGRLSQEPLFLIRGRNLYESVYRQPV